MKDFRFEAYCPLVLFWVIHLILFPFKIIIFVLLPPDACYEFHKLNWLYKFITGDQ